MRRPSAKTVSRQKKGKVLIVPPVFYHESQYEALAPPLAPPRAVDHAGPGGHIRPFIRGSASTAARRPLERRPVQQRPRPRPLGLCRWVMGCQREAMTSHPPHPLVASLELLCVVRPAAVQSGSPWSAPPSSADPANPWARPLNSPADPWEATPATGPPANHVWGSPKDRGTMRRRLWDG